MNYYVRAAGSCGRTNHVDVTAASVEQAAEMAANKSIQLFAPISCTVYEQVGTHNILAQREPVVVVTVAE